MAELDQDVIERLRNVRQQMQEQTRKLPRTDENGHPIPEPNTTPEAFDFTPKESKR